jgi:hypothetical protein
MYYSQYDFSFLNILIGDGSNLSNARDEERCCVSGGCRYPQPNVLNCALAVQGHRNGQPQSQPCTPSAVESPTDRKKRIFTK